jgi:hypothetical protein
MKALSTGMDGIMAPLSRLPAELALTLFSVLTGIVILLLFKISSNPARIAAARDRALSRVLELWLFREDAFGGLLSVGRAMRDSFGYLGSMLRPALVSMIPMLILLVQANAWFGYRPLAEGEAALLTVRATGPGIVERLELISPEGLTVEASVAASAASEKSWRIRAGSEEGTHRLSITGGGIDETKSLRSGSAPARISALRTNSRLEHLLYPDEPPLSGALERITLAYTPAGYRLLGFEMPWIVFLLIVSLITGLALKKPLGVEF